MTCGIYFIRNTNTQKVYVGSSNDIEKRWSVHKYFLRKGEHHSSKLQASWNKHGEDAFVFEIIEVTEESALFVREQHYFESMQAVENGYNCASCAESSSRGKVLDEDTKAAMSEAALEVAGRPGESERRSERAKKQHEQGKFGRSTWTEASKKKTVEDARDTAVSYALWEHAYKNKTRKEVWTPERRAAKSLEAREHHRRKKLEGQA